MKKIKYLVIAFFSITIFAPNYKVLSNEESNISYIASNINVKIYGPGQPGTGVLLQKENNEYTVLTAWHVLKGVQRGDEIDIQTNDGKLYLFKQNSIQRIDDVDLAIVKFESEKSYEIAQIGNVNNLSMGDKIFVGGYPLANSSITESIFRFQPGVVTANTKKFNKDGYQILYTNKTIPGMSGGSLLSSNGKLIGIHGRSELDEISSDANKLVSTGTNMGIPIKYYTNFLSGSKNSSLQTKNESADDFLVEAFNLFGDKDKALEMLMLSKKSIALKPTALGYTLIGKAKEDLGDTNSALEEYEKALLLNPDIELALKFKAEAKRINDMTEAKEHIKVYDKLIKLNPQQTGYFLGRAITKHLSGDINGALTDLKKGINLYNENLAYCKTLEDKQIQIFRDYGSGSSEFSRALKQSEKKGCYRLEYWQENLLLRAGNIEYALGNISKACQYWNDGYSFQTGIKWMEGTRDFLFTFSSYDIYQSYSFSREANFNRNIPPKDMKFLTDIQKKYPKYFNRAAEIENWRMKDTAEVIYEKCLD